MSEHEILYATIKNFELEERLRRRDYKFDAFTFLAQSIGHKNPSTLRKMCQLASGENGAKLGFREAIIIMDITRDYRLYRYMEEELKSMARSDERQLDLFAQPIRSLTNTSNDETETRELR